MISLFAQGLNKVIAADIRIGTPTRKQLLNSSNDKHDTHTECNTKKKTRHF